MRDGSKATAALRAEHRVIMRVVDVLERLVERDLVGAAPVDDLEACLTFFRLYTDVCHHGKEEDLLFAALEEHGVPAGGPIHVMREEHRAGRTLVGAMRSALERLRAGDGRAPLMLRGAAHAYVALIRDHVRKEDDGLFDVADEIVDSEACRKLCQAYETACRRKFDGHTLPELEQLADDLAARNPPG